MGRRGLIIVSAVIAGCFFVVLSLCSPAAAAANALLSSDSLPRRPFLGVTAEPAPGNHVRIAKIVPGSSAARSELTVGDTLLAVNGSPVEAVAAFLAGMKSFKSGDHLIYRVQRDQRWISRSP